MLRIRNDADATFVTELIPSKPFCVISASSQHTMQDSLTAAEVILVYGAVHHLDDLSVLRRRSG